VTLAPPPPRPSPAPFPPAPPSRPDASRLRASAGQRAGAYFIDLAIVAAITVLVWLLTGSIPLVAVTAIELWAIGWIWEGHTGATPGNLACGIRTVRRDAPVSVGAPRLFPRSLLTGLAHVIPVLLPVALAASGALDGLSGARVIDVRRARAATSAELGTPSLDARVTGSDLITRAPGARDRTVAIPTEPAPSATAAPQAPAQPMPTGPGTIPVFELSDGTVIRATGLGFIGRAPRAPEAITDAILIRVPDGARSLSRTHASFGLEDGELWVQDLGSANGARIRHLGGGVSDLIPHTPRFLVPGDVLVLGDDAELLFRTILDRRAVAPSVDAQPAAPLAGAERSPSAPAERAPARQEPAEPARPGPLRSDRAAATAASAGAAVQSPAAGSAARTPDPTPAVARAVAFRFQNGVVVPVRGTGYIGRAPSLPDGESPDAVLVAVPDGDRSVSRTHGRFGILDGQTWFEDLGSGNGSTLRTDDGRTGPMTPHQRFMLEPGMLLQLGDCTVQVIAG